MQKFEYSIVTDCSQAKLNEMGAGGWELVTVLPSQSEKSGVGVGSGGVSSGGGHTVGAYGYSISFIPERAVFKRPTT